MTTDWPATLLCADWSTDPRRRAVYVADVAGLCVRRAAVATAWTVETVLELAATGPGPVLLGFDAPLGVPASYWKLVRAHGPWSHCSSFAEWVRSGPSLDSAGSLDAWTVERPFIAVPPGAGSLTRWKAALRARGVEMVRKVEQATGAKSVFVVSGIPGSVGGAARDLWTGLAKAHREGRRFSIWPFESRADGVTVAEIYPRAAYALALSGDPAQHRRPRRLAKTAEDVRRKAVRQLLEAPWVGSCRVSLHDSGAALRSEDEFDALFAAAGLLRCVLEATPLSDPALEDAVAEGAILGTGSVSFGAHRGRMRTSPDRGGRYDSGIHEGANMPAKVAEVATPASRATEDDLRAMPRDGRKYELVDGQIVVSPAGIRHGIVALRLGARLLAFVESNDLGYVLDSSTGLRLPGGNVRSPDVSFIAKGRFAGERLPEGFPDLAPDLAVEVLSPDDRPRAILDKVGEYLQAGVRLVRVIDPRAARAAVYRSLTDVRELAAADSLDGEDVLPGFRCVLDEVLK